MRFRWAFFGLVVAAQAASATADEITVVSRGSRTCNASGDVGGHEHFGQGSFAVWWANAAQHASPSSLVATRRPAWQSVPPRFASMHVDILHAPFLAQTSRLSRRALRSSRRPARRKERAAPAARLRRRSLLARHACVVALTLPVNVSVNLSLAVFAMDAAVLLPRLKQYHFASADQRSRRRVQGVSMVGGGPKKISHVCTVEVSGNHIWMAVFEEGRSMSAMLPTRRGLISATRHLKMGRARHP